MDEVGVRRLLRAQDGVVARRQLLELDGQDHDIERMLRRKELAVVHPGVYVDHTGELSARQRAWAAVLFAAPAALCGESVLDLESRPVHVAIDSARRVRVPDGVVVHRVAGLAERALWNLSPPRMRVEDAVLDLVERARSEADVVGLLTEAVNDRLTTPARLRASVGVRKRLRRRRLVLAVLDDVEAGACSVLEHGYLTRVERAHGLPRAARQQVRRTEAGVEYRDVEYAELGLVVELDGQVAHEGWAAGGRDADRDLDDRAEGRETVRLRHQQVFDTPCRTASRIAAILQRRGWTGSPRSCGPECAVAA